MTIAAEAPGIQLHTVRRSMDRDALATLAALQKIGYRSVELAGLHGRSPQDLRAMLDAAGLTAVSGHVAAEELRRRSGPALEAAAILGQRFIVCSGADREWLPAAPGVSDVRRLAAVLADAGAAALAFGLRFGYHNHAEDHVRIGDSTLYDLLLEECDPSLVFMELDVYWAVRGGRNPSQDLDRHPGRFPLLHLKDMDESGGMADVGAGVLDFPAILNAGARSGTEHAFVEHDDPPSPLESAAASHRFLSTLRVFSP